MTRFHANARPTRGDARRRRFAPFGETLLAGLVVFALVAAPARAAQTATLERVATMIRQGRVAEAERQLAAVLKAAPNSAGALNLLGTIRAQQGRLAEAETLFTRAAGADAKFVGPRMNLAYLYMLKGMPEKTIAELKEVVGLDPDNADAATKLARLLLSRNHVEDAIAFIEAEKQRPSPPPALLSVLGDAYASKGDAAKAEENYLLALARDAADATALLGMARVSRARADAPATVRYLSLARAAAANAPELLYACGLVALESGLNDEARAALLAAAQLKPADAPTQLLLGVAWLKKPDLLEAEQSLRRAIALEPDNAQAQVFLGYVLLKLKKFDEARALLERSVTADASAPEGPYYLGLVAQEQKDDERAVEILKRVIQQFPTYSHAHVALGISYMRLKDFAHAREELEQAVKMNPGDQKAHYNLAMLYARLKESELAQAEMRVVEELKSRADAQALEDEELAPPVPGPR